MSEPTPTSAPNAVAATRRDARRPVIWFVVVTLLAAALLVWIAIHRSGVAPNASDKRHGHGAATIVSVAAAPVLMQSMPIWVTALGTVTPHSYVNVMPRVAGLLQSVNYREGQLVKAGQLLAQIDPRPFHIAVAQAQAQLLRDQAQLNGAQRNLKRFQTLLAQDSIAAQQVDDQKALVAQYTATLAVDRAALDTSQLQLSYTRIIAPVSGLAGLRPIDAGNMVNTGGAIGASPTPVTSGANGNVNSGGGNATPIVTLAQVQPVNVSFAIAQSQIGSVVQRLHSGETLAVEAWNANNTARLASGKLLAADNQISVATGTLNLKAEFANASLALYPNQFVNVRLRVATLNNALVVPAAAVATGAPGTYVYLIGADHKVTVRPVTTGVSADGLTVIAAGLQAGDQVVTDGLDRLHAGVSVRVAPPQTQGNAQAGPHSGGHGSATYGASTGRTR